MKQIQTKSAILLFFLINIVLSRQHSLFSFITALMPLLLNRRTKYWFYQKANDLTVFIYGKKDLESKNFIVRQKRHMYEDEVPETVEEASK